MTTIETTEARYQREAKGFVREVFAAARRKDIALLESYHLYGPSFSKFDDFEPLARQDSDLARESEREALEAVREFETEISGLKIDLFLPLAIATFVLHYDVTLQDGEKLETTARSTMILLKTDTSWQIVHEHFSSFTANG